MTQADRGGVPQVRFVSMRKAVSTMLVWEERQNGWSDRWLGKWYRKPEVWKYLSRSGLWPECHMSSVTRSGVCNTSMEELSRDVSGGTEQDTTNTCIYDQETSMNNCVKDLFRTCQQEGYIQFFDRWYRRVLPNDSPYKLGMDNYPSHKLRRVWEIRSLGGPLTVRKGVQH